ncbi:MAG: class I SAM-dependent methyltransferase [Gemmatimonadota bacterium]
MTTPWWRHHFDETYLRLHGHRFPEAGHRREVAAALDMLGLPLGSHVLDLPCGWGRHANLISEAGQEVVGADLSATFLAQAAEDGHARGLASRFAAADLRALPFRDGSFDAVVNLHSSLGLFLDDREDVRALAETRRVLRPGGRLLVETMHRDDVVRHYAPRDSWRLADGTEVRVRRRFDPSGRKGRRAAPSASGTPPSWPACWRPQACGRPCGWAAGTVRRSTPVRPG